MTAPTDRDAAHFVDRFGRAWAATDPDAFTPLFRPDVRLVHPIERDTRGIDDARAFMARTMALVPDLSYELHGWASGSGTVLIWGRLHGTLAGGPVEWHLVDRITLVDGLIAERVAYFDPLVVLGTVLRRPRAWLPFLAGRLRARRCRSGRAGLR